MAVVAISARALRGPWDADSTASVLAIEAINVRDRSHSQQDHRKAKAAELLPCGSWIDSTLPTG
jgi:hypothetical protein